MLRRPVLSVVKRQSRFYSSVPSSEYLVLQYYYVSDIAEKRPPFRAQHLHHAKEWHQKGKLLLGGAWADLSGAQIIFKDCKEKDVEEFVVNDPYVKNKLVTGWNIKPWTVVIGN
eukprot:CAMPEP_0174251500 /NCGR_PEP_ID=MMETSP0439-20130205/1306_1 /TAXON_ID=0 /ORGANISM="Stereomyxa ramosa, Strain Chinc5" /LENGTH=113 /DNA_ID=CAMNT_0015331829 /DNA_START=33 /DNA_END=374 /DNA_ORIENTATION=+